VVRPEVVVVVLSINMQGKRRLGSGKVRSQRSCGRQEEEEEEEEEGFRRIKFIQGLTP